MKGNGQMNYSKTIEMKESSFEGAVDFENKKVKDYINSKLEKEGLNMDKEIVNKQAQKVLDIAEQLNCDDNYFFTTTFERYCVQNEILENLKSAVESDGMFVKKEYVKGRENVYTHPAITDYNRTTDSANKTVGTLMRIIKIFGDKQNRDTKDPLLELISGYK